MIRDGIEIADDDRLLYLLGEFDGSNVEHIGGANWVRRTSSDGQPYGIVWIHVRTDVLPLTTLCMAGANWRQPNGWTLHSLDPLHIEPSLLCRACGAHGFIRGGRWVAC